MIALDDNLIPNTASLAHLRVLRGYDLPVSRQTRQLMAGLQSPPQSPWFPIKTQPSEALLSFANVRAVVTDSQQIEWLDKDSPRAWFTPCYQSVADSQAALQMVSREDLRSCPPVEISWGIRQPPSITPVASKSRTLNTSL